MGDISDFAAEAADRFVQSQQEIEHRFDLQLPREAVESLVRTVFYASLIPNEGRYPVVQLMSYRRDNDAACSFPFETPCEPTAEEIARLAHAVGAASHICCFSDHGSIHLGGIHVTVLNEMRDFGYCSFRIGNPLRLRIRGPGHVEMSTGGIALVYRAGEITEENLLQHSSIVRQMCVTVEERVRHMTRGVVESLEDVFNDICEKIVRLRHGGLILVVKELYEKGFSSLRRVHSSLMQGLMVRYWNSVADYQAERRRLGGDPDSHHVNPYSVVIASDTAIIEKGVSALADMAGMDGATILDHGFRVVALNAIIDRAEVPQQNCALVDAAGGPLRAEDIVGGRGSRHQAAFSFAMANPLAFAFVVSQDGGISAFHNPGNGMLICETQLRVLD